MNLPNLLLSDSYSALKKIYNSRLSKVILFGSYSRGEQTNESDLDLLVVLNDDSLSAAKEIRFMNATLFPISLKYDVPISAHPVSAVRFESEPSFFYSRIKMEGIVL
jgi:predicted nucleotidyltransferase